MKVCQAELSSLGDIRNSFAGLFIFCKGQREETEQKTIHCKSEGLDLELGCCIKSTNLSQVTVKFFGLVILRNSSGCVVSKFLPNKARASIQNFSVCKQYQECYSTWFPLLPFCFVLYVFCFTLAFLIRYYFWFNSITAL